MAKIETMNHNPPLVCVIDEQENQSEPKLICTMELA